MDIDFADIQGIVRFGYKSMTEACYELVRIKDLASARAWLLDVPITSAMARKPPPPTAVHVAFTAEGLATLGVPRNVRGAFSHEFRSGMTEPSRARRLGDIGVNASEKWTWGGSARVPHLVVMFFAEPGRLAAWMNEVKGSAWSIAFEPLEQLATANLDGVEPFGFVDGISQPQIDWEQERNTQRAQIDYGNVTALGEFVLGYRNEYGKYTDRPVIEADATSAGLPDALDAPGKKDVARNGTYVVIRTLEQDVRAFWRFMAERSGGEYPEAQKLAASMVGRTMDGDPLAKLSPRPIPGIGPDRDQVLKNQFTFDDDPGGTTCPIGAHVRRTNPRNSDFVGEPGLIGRLLARLGFGDRSFNADLTSSVRFHRIIRRGREYGSGISPVAAVEPAPAGERARGLHFICLNANISRQFEFVQHAWTMSANFAGLPGENDPLTGNRAGIPGCQPSAAFTMPQEGALSRHVNGLEQFVTVRGGAYFFLPGLRALRYLAGGGEGVRSSVRTAARNE